MNHHDTTARPDEASPVTSQFTAEQAEKAGKAEKIIVGILGIGSL
jgi:hypothetical protein